MANTFYPWTTGSTTLFYVGDREQIQPSLVQQAPAAKTLWFGEAPQTGKPKYLKQTPTTNCCGCDFIEWFPENGFCSRDLYNQMDAEISGHIKTANSMLIAILNSKQKPNYGSLLEKHGFKVLMDGVFHPNHGNYLTLYGYEKHKKDNANGQSV